MFERFTKSARYAVVNAQEEARELRSATIDVEHVLLGILTCQDDKLRTTLADNGLTAEGLREQLAPKYSGEPLGEEPLGEQDAAALRSIGIDLDAVRESLEATFGEDALDRAVPAEERKGGWFRRGGSMAFGHIPFTREAKKVLELSLREALARDDKSIDAGHILLGVLRAPNERTRELLGGEDGIRQLRQAVHDLLDRAA
ncbi:Clp protease N-terminal domain-containing protein [Nocardia transvalensis]|uniref:Clp protease N-terminal domain-containing protein n=1 Tax=Nocardia transvalensis TaxID=37333 RepID=UPI0018954585|nr:Clp protease N-terminal domain-containing protein [Nocardia transvalensis]MBF6333733.1 Clp protease [Nocardia transvalensis]